MPIVREHPAPQLEGSYYFKRLPSEPRFDAVQGVAVTVELDNLYVSGVGPTATKSVVVTVRARDLADAPIALMAGATQKVVVALTPSWASTATLPATPSITVGAVSAAVPAQQGDEYVFTCTLSCRVSETPDFEEVLKQGVRATVTSTAGRTGVGSASFYYITRRPGAVTTFTATSWIRGIRLSWKTPDQLSGDSVTNNTALSYYLIRLTTTPPAAAPTLSAAQARALIAEAGDPNYVPPPYPGGPTGQHATFGAAGLDPRVYRVTGNAYVDPVREPLEFHYWLVAVDLFNGQSTLSSRVSAIPGYIEDTDFEQGSIDIATIAARNSAANAVAAGSVTTTKLGVLNAAFDPEKISSHARLVSNNIVVESNPASQNYQYIAWKNLTIVVGDTPTVTVNTVPNGEFGVASGTSDQAIVWLRASNTLAQYPRSTYLAQLDALNLAPNEDYILLGFNLGGKFVQALGGTIIRGDTIETGTILADRLDVNELSAITAKLGAIETGIIWDAPTLPTSVIRLSSTDAPGITQNHLGQPVMAGSVIQGATVSVTAGGIATFSQTVALNVGDVIERGTTNYSVLSGSGTTYTVTPALLAASGAFVIKRPVRRLIDLAAATVDVVLGGPNRRFLSVVDVSSGTPVDKIFIAADGSAKFTGELVSNVLTVGTARVRTGQAGLEVGLPSWFDGLVTATEMNVFALTATGGTFTDLKIQSNPGSTDKVQLGYYNIPQTYVAPTSRINYGVLSSTGNAGTIATSSTGDAVTSSDSVFLTTEVSGQIFAPYGNEYNLRVVPVLKLPPTVPSGYAVPSGTTTVVVERRLGAGGNWTQVASRVLAAPYPYTPVNGYGPGPEDVYIDSWNIGDGPTENLGTDGGDIIVPITSTLVDGTGTLTVTSNAVEFTSSQAGLLKAGFWIQIANEPYKIATDSGDGLHYTITGYGGPLTTAAGTLFKRYDYATTIRIPVTSYDAAFHPYYRVRLTGQAAYQTGWDITTAPEDMQRDTVDFALASSDASISFQYQNAASSAMRHNSAAVYGGYLYLKPQVFDLNAVGAVGEIAMRDVSGVVTPHYYSGSAWVPFGTGGAGGSILVNSNSASALVFTGGGVTVSTAAGVSTITVSGAAAGVTTLGGVSGDITLGGNLSMTGSVLNVINVLTPANFNTYALSLQGGTVTGQVTVRSAANQDAILLSGRAGGTAGYAVTLTPTTLTGNRTLTLPDASGTLLLDSRTVTLNGTANQVAVTGTATQALSTNLSWTVGLASDVDIANTLDVGSVGSLSATGVIARIGGGLRVGGTIYANDFVLEGGVGGSGTGLSLNLLDDVTITGTPATGEILQYSSGQWRNVAASFGSSLIVQDEGVQATASATTINFTGTNVTATAVGGVVTVAVSGSPSAHTHPISDITGLQAALDGKAALVHTHVIADVTGLQTALDGKAAASHTHTIANVTGLQTALDGKAANTITISAGTGLTGGGDLTLNRSLALTGQALALHNLASNGIIARTGADTVSARTITASGTIITVTNGDGVAGNPTIGINTANITSVGTLTSLNVSGNIVAGGTITATDFILTGGTGGSGTGLTLDSLDDVITAAPYTPANNNVLTYDTSVSGGKWIPKTLSTLLAVQSGGSAVASRQTLNFISGTNATVTVADDVANSRVNITVSATGSITSVFGRTGTITAQEGDYSLDQLGGVAISGTPSNRVLRHNGVGWIDDVLVASDIPTLTAAKISDFNTQVRTNRLNEMSAPNAAVSFNSQNITNVATITATTFSGSLSGNASTVTNGVYTTGSYADPAWITSLAWSKVTGRPTTLAGYGITDAQALDADLTAIAALGFTSTAFLKKTAANTWALDTNVYLTGNQTVTLSGDVSGSGATSITTTLATLAGLVAGTYGGNNSIPSITIDVKGRVTAISTVTPSGTWNISISGNAATVTNGVYTTLSYSDPAWLTTLSGSKVSGNISGNAANITAYTINQNLGTGNSPSFVALTLSGNATAADFVLGSDRRLKTDLVPLTGTLDALDQLDAYRYVHLRHQRVEVGVIAQELQTVLPEAVSQMEDGMLGVTYDRLVPFLLAAVKELKARVIDLEHRNQE